MKPVKVTADEVVRYYQSSQTLYDVFCYNRNTLGMHFGFWYKDTKNRNQSLENENQSIVELGNIKPGSKVLDAGCGIGGTVFYIANKTKANVWGVTIAAHQVELAKRYAQIKDRDHLVEFSVQDYCQTDFPDNFFDVVYGIESICHTSPKTKFLREAFRILKPGGKLIIADGYVSKDPKTVTEKRIISDFNWAFALPEMITPEVMKKQISGTGFKNISVLDMYKEIAPSIKYFADLSFYTLPLTFWTKYIPISMFRAIYRNSVALRCVANADKIHL